MPAIDGIVSGIDTTALINGIIGAAAVPLQFMQADLTLFKERQTKLAALATKFTEVQTAIEKFDELSELKIAKQSTEEATQFSATVDGDSKTGSYDIKVIKLATGQVTSSQGFADATATGVISQGTMDVTINGVTSTVTVDGTNDSLDSFAAALDDVDGLTAYVLNTGAPSNPYQLVVQSDDTGSDGAFTFDTAGLVTGGSLPVFTNMKTSQNAEIEVNGITIFSSSNTVKDPVPGLSLELLQTGTATERLGIEQNDDALVELVQGFADSYNEALGFHSTNSFFNTETGNRGPLNGDSAARRAISGLGQAISSSYTVTGAFVSLAQVGFSTGRDGTIEFDESKFRDVLFTNRDDIYALFTEATGPLKSITSDIENLYVDSENGILTSREESLKSSIEDYEERIENFEGYLDSYTERLRKQFTNMEITLGRLQASQGAMASLFAGMNNNNS
jgi:flagellar hook-associated protein 2